MKQFLLVLLALGFLSGCSSWVYKYDIVQGNYLNQRDVNKLRINMTKEQVKFVLGAPVVSNAFRDDDWHYVYTRRVGKTDELIRKEMVVHFDGDKVTKVSGDFDKPENFDTPLDSE